MWCVSKGFNQAHYWLCKQKPNSLFYLFYYLIDFLKGGGIITVCRAATIIFITDHVKIIYLINWLWKKNDKLNVKPTVKHQMALCCRTRSVFCPFLPWVNRLCSQIVSPLSAFTTRSLNIVKAAFTWLVVASRTLLKHAAASQLRRSHARWNQAERYSVYFCIWQIKHTYI